MTPHPILAETVLTLSQAAALATVSRDTVRRWLTKGLRGVRLAACRCGGHWRTSREAVGRFLVAVDPANAARPGPSAAQRRKDSERIDRELAAAGW